MATAPAKTKTNTQKPKAAKSKTAETSIAETNTATTSITAPTLSCPECGKTFTRAAALGAHRKLTHGVAGTSTNATGNRKRTAARKRATAASSPGPRRTAAATNGGSISVDRDALLRALFPNGIPPRQNLIVQINEWLDQAERLARSR